MMLLAAPSASGGQAGELGIQPSATRPVSRSILDWYAPSQISTFPAAAG